MAYVAETTDCFSQFQWPEGSDMASTEGAFQVSTDLVADSSANQANLQTMELPLQQMDCQAELQVADKQAIVLDGLQAMDEGEVIDIGSEIKLPIVPEGANLIEDQQPAILEVHLPEEMDTETDSAFCPPAVRDTTKAGYDCKFLDPDVASEYNCSICLSVSRDPQQTKCCGSTFCLYCIQEALASSKGPSCSKCNSESVELIPDKAQRQKINKLKVRCPIEGCRCIVELADIEAHKRVPHPVTPPTNLHRESRQQYYNTLPIPLHKKQQPKPAETGWKRPVPTPRVLLSKSSENEQRDFPHLPLSQPDQEVPGSDLSKDHNELPDHLNLTMTRPRVSRQRPDPSPPDPKRQRGYINIEAMPQSTVIPQPDTLPNTDQNVPRQSQTEPQLVPLQDQAQQTTNQTHTTASDDIYENVVIAPKPHSACDLTLPEAGSETESALPVTSSEFKVILKPRVPRDRPSSQSPPGEQDEMARPPSPQSLLLPKLPQSPVKLQHPAHTYDLTPHVPSSTTPQPDYEVVATPGLDEFGMMHFRATREEANPQRTVHMEEHTNVAVPDPSPLNEQEVPTQNVFPQYINVASPGPQLPLLPDDLLALLDNPTASPQLDQVQGQSTYNGAPLSPLSSPQLATQLLTLPEQLLNMIQPVPDETIEPKAADNENAPLLSPTEGPDYVNFSQNRENEESYVEISPFHEGSQSEQSDYVEVASPPQEETPFEYLPMSPFHEEIQPEYVEVTHQQNEAEEQTADDYVPMSPPPHTSLADYVEVASPPQEETPFEYLPMSPFHEEIQPEYVEVTHQQNEAEEQTADDYVPMSPPPHTSLADYVEVEPARQREPSSVPAAPRPRVTSKESEYEIPLLQDMDQQEYEGVPSGAQATATAEQAQANEAPMFLPLLPPPEVVATLPQARAPEEENYETIPAAAREEDDTTEHIYEPLPPPRSPPTPEEPDQPMYIDVPDPLPASPPPVLPPRSQSEPPEPRLNQEPAPPVPPRPSSQAIAPPGTAPQDQNQEAPVVRETIPAPATDAVPAQPPETEIINQTEDGVAALNQVLQELQQGNALELTESMPPQYDDLSQTPRYIDLVQSPAVQQNPLQAAPSPHGQAYIIQNINTNTATRGPIRAENVDIHYEMGDRQHHRNKNMKKTQTLL